MTAQAPEILWHEGVEHALCTTPLEDWFASSGTRVAFAAPSSALWRGYRGTWAIRGGRLYLIGLWGMREDGSEIALATLFPDSRDCVFAHWYSGTLRLPRGKLLEYVHGGFASRYEEDVFITIEHGVVVGERVERNGTATDPAAEDGYHLAGFATFPVRTRRS